MRTKMEIKPAKEERKKWKKKWKEEK